MASCDVRTGLLIATLLQAAAPAATAADGRIELDSARALAGVPEIGDAPDYPVTIALPGSYVLTGSLAPPDKTSAIVVAARDVQIDLNGHAIRGSFTCAAGGCSVNAGFGIETPPGGGGGTTIRNGVVRGFGSDCVQVSEGSRIAGLHVADCGEDGIEAGPGSEVRESSIQRVGRHGVSFSRGSGSFVDNTIFDMARDGAAGLAVSGGRAIGGNDCASGHCSPRGARRYYLTTAAAAADEVLEACVPGFQVASALEIRDTSALEYASHLGDVEADGGRGPVSNALGWVRTGQAVSTTQNCSAFTSTSGTQSGYLLTLRPPSTWNAVATTLSPWQASVAVPCDTVAQVWCIED